MTLDWIWRSALVIICGMVLLRIAGRKSISQMTVATTVIMISIGTTIVQPIANDKIWIAIGSATIFILMLLIIEYLQVKFNWFEKIITGKSKVIIQNGQVLKENLSSMRITVDQIETRLRQLGISNLSDVQTATLEPNGQMGYELMQHAKPLTVGEFERILGMKAGFEQNNLFQEVLTNHHSSPTESKLK